MFLITVTPTAVEARPHGLRSDAFEVKGQAVRVHHGTSFVHFAADDEAKTALAYCAGAG